MGWTPTAALRFWRAAKPLTNLVADSTDPVFAPPAQTHPPPVLASEPFAWGFRAPAVLILHVLLTCLPGERLDCAVSHGSIHVVPVRET